MRNEIAAKMRLLMQTHCSETLLLLDKGVPEGLLRPNKAGGGAVASASGGTAVVSPLSPLTKMLQSETLAAGRKQQQHQQMGGGESYDSPQQRYELFSPAKDPQRASSASATTDNSTSDSGHVHSASSSSSSAAVHSSSCSSAYAMENGVSSTPLHARGTRLTVPASSFVYHQSSQQPEKQQQQQKKPQLQQHELHDKSEDLQNFLRLLIGQSDGDKDGGHFSTNDSKASSDSQMERLLSLMNGEELKSVA